MILKKINKYPFFIKALSVGIIVRLLIILLTVIFPQLQIQSDAVTYEVGALKIISEWHKGNFFFKDVGGMGSFQFLYYMFDAVLFYFFGFHSIIPRIINCIVGVLAAYYVYKATIRIFGKSPAKIALLLMLFFPSLLYWQTLNIKEAIIVLLFAVVLNNLIKLKFDPSLKNFIITIVFLVLLSLTRMYTGVFLGVGICIYFFINSKISLNAKILMIGIVFIGANILSYKIGLGIMGWNVLKDFSLEYIDEVRKTQYRGGSEVLLNMSMSTPLGLIMFLPVGLLYYMFSPFPWNIGGTLFQTLALLENVIWYILFFGFFFIGFKIAYKKERLISLVMIGVMTLFILLYSISMGNMGIAFRLRSQLMPFFFIFISIGISKILDKYFTNTTKKIILDRLLFRKVC